MCNKGLYTCVYYCNCIFRNLINKSVMRIQPLHAADYQMYSKGFPQVKVPHVHVKGTKGNLCLSHCFKGPLHMCVQKIELYENKIIHVMRSW